MWWVKGPPSPGGGARVCVGSGFARGLGDGCHGVVWGIWGSVAGWGGAERDRGRPPPPEPIAHTQRSNALEKKPCSMFVRWSSRHMCIFKFDFRIVSAFVLHPGCAHCCCSCGCGAVVIDDFVNVSIAC